MDLLGKDKNKMFHNPYLDERGRGVPWALGFADVVPGYQLAWLNDRSYADKQGERARLAKEKLEQEAALELQSIAKQAEVDRVSEVEAERDNAIRTAIYNASLSQAAAMLASSPVAESARTASVARAQSARLGNMTISFKLPIMRRPGQSVNLSNPSRYVRIS